MIAIIGGVVVLIIILVAVMMMGGGSSSVDASAPSTDTLNEYNPEAASEEVPTANVGDEDVPELEEEEPVQEVEVSEDTPSVEDPTSIEGCVGWFTGESFDDDEQVWKDLSGKGNDCTEIRGEIFKTDDSKGNYYIQGGKEDGLKFPKACMTNTKKHTFFSVAKYARQQEDTSARTNERIFDGVDANYLVGFHGYSPCSGVYGTGHRDGNGWIGHWECSVYNKDKWVLHTDQKSLVRVNGALKTGNTTKAEKRTSQMTINDGMGRGWGQSSEWQVGECIFYDRELNDEEMTKVELMLHKKWGIPRRVRTQQWVHNNVWDRYWQDATGGFTNKDAFDTVNRFGVTCGDTGTSYMGLRFVQHHYYDATEEKWKPNGNWGNDGGCLVNSVSGAGAEKKTQWTSLEENRSWQERLSSAFDIDCGRNGLQNWEFELSPNKDQMRTRYRCTKDQLNKNACTNDFRPVNGDNSLDMPSALHNVLGGCHNGQAINKLSFEENDGKWGYMATCCPLEDQ